MVSTNTSDMSSSAHNATGVRMDSSLTQMVFHVSRDHLQDVDLLRSQLQTTLVACQDVLQVKSGKMEDAWSDVEPMKDELQTVETVLLSVERVKSTLQMERDVWLLSSTMETRFAREEGLDVTELQSVTSSTVSVNQY